jgi:hypothetical protein
MIMKRVCLLFAILPLVTDVSAQRIEATQSPHGASMKRDCRLCHNTKDWTVDAAKVRFNHQETRYPLTEAHVNVRCRACHQNLEFTAVGRSCSDCHTDFHQGRMGRDCGYCHTSGSWEDRRKVRENHARTLFPLTGAHASADCEDCHGIADRRGFAGASTACFACHEADYRRALDPNHAAGQLPADCALCHTQTAWIPATFDHNTTVFPLTGAHKTTACIACHPNNHFTGTPMDCWSCHETNYIQAMDPNHATNRFDHDCMKCHTQTAWIPATFDHNATAFPLTGAHKTTACIACHPNNLYAGTPGDCWACHEKDFNQAADPNHAAGRLDHDCLKCHTQNAWTPAAFDHNATAFPLTGAHVTTACMACHPNNHFTGTPKDCWSCHETNYIQATDPNHASNQFDHDCLKCHTQTAWTPSTFDHNATAFPLTGAHMTTACIACHTNNRYAGTPKDCWSCHETNYIQATDPNHATNQFDHDCLKCHSQTAWTPATFDHNATGFPLTGAHKTTACIACHPNNIFAGTLKDCWSCHETNYIQATDPNHATNQFDHDCLKCHSQTAWAPATFNHATTVFPLTGAHVPLACAACHLNGYAGTPSDCYFCHETAYNQTADPNHKSAGFPLNCQSCHTTARWTGAKFDHDASFFPIYSGSHAGRWNACSDCHTNSSNYTVFSCINCHSHDQTTTNAYHRGVSGYRYDSAYCYQCHFGRTH